MVAIEEILPAVARSAAWSWMRNRYLPAGPVCACGIAIRSDRALAAWEDLRTVYCHDCGRRSAPTTGTPIAATSWQPEEFVQLLLLRTAGRSHSQISAALGKSAKTISDMIDRLALWHGPADQSSASLAPTGIQRERAARGRGWGQGSTRPTANNSQGAQL